MLVRHTGKEKLSVHKSLCSSVYCEQFVERFLRRYQHEPYRAKKVIGEKSIHLVLSCS